jgi:hypothetical protein
MRRCRQSRTPVPVKTIAVAVAISPVGAPALEGTGSVATGIVVDAPRVGPVGGGNVVEGGACIVVAGGGTVVVGAGIVVVTGATVVVVVVVVDVVEEVVVDCSDGLPPLAVSTSARSVPVT